MMRNNGWDSILQSPECRAVLAQVAALRKKGEHVYPSQKDVFRAFEDCPLNKVRVVRQPGRGPIVTLANGQARWRPKMSSVFFELSNVNIQTNSILGCNQATAVPTDACRKLGLLI
jgi:hypothetical protein